MNPNFLVAVTFLLGTEEVEGILILLAGVVISLEGRASPAASGAFAMIGVVSLGRIGQMSKSVK